MKPYFPFILFAVALIHSLNASTSNSTELDDGKLGPQDDSATTVLSYDKDDFSKFVKTIGEYQIVSVCLVRNNQKEVDSFKISSFKTIDDFQMDSGLIRIKGVRHPVSELIKIEYKKKPATGVFIVGGLILGSMIFFPVEGINYLLNKKYDFRKPLIYTSLLTIVFTISDFSDSKKVNTKYFKSFRTKTARAPIPENRPP